MDNRPFTEEETRQMNQIDRELHTDSRILDDLQEIHARNKEREQAKRETINRRSRGNGFDTDHVRTHAALELRAQRDRH